MGAKIIGFLATFLLSIPLAAIGLMAVFGIPQLVPANGDSTNPRDKVIRGVRDALSWGESPETQQEHVASEFGDAPPFGADSQTHTDRDWPRDQVENRVADSATSSGIFDVPPQRNLDSSQAIDRPERLPSAPPRHWSEIPSMGNERISQNHRDVPANQRNAAATLTRPGARPAAHVRPAFDQQTPLQAQAPLLTWRQASLRLTELGVEDYHLERGTAAGTFLFVCTFSPGDAPHVVHRFEAEMDDPLLAVNQVLQQVDHWMRSRYAAANFPSKPQSLSLAPDSQ